MQFNEEAVAAATNAEPTAGNTETEGMNTRSRTRAGATNTVAAEATRVAVGTALEATGAEALADVQPGEPGQETGTQETAAVETVQETAAAATVTQEETVEESKLPEDNTEPANAARTNVPTGGNNGWGTQNNRWTTTNTGGWGAPSANRPATWRTPRTGPWGALLENRAVGWTNENPTRPQPNREVNNGRQVPYTHLAYGNNNTRGRTPQGDGIPRGQGIPLQEEPINQEREDRERLYECLRNVLHFTDGQATTLMDDGYMTIDDFKYWKFDEIQKWATNKTKLPLSKGGRPYSAYNVKKL